MKISIEDWLKELRQVAVAFDPTIESWYCFENESWEDFYNNDYTPAEAFAEDLTYWEA